MEQVSKVVEGWDSSNDAANDPMQGIEKSLVFFTISTAPCMLEQTSVDCPD